jgi:hypothetical protein
MNHLMHPIHHKQSNQPSKDIVRGDAFILQGHYKLQEVTVKMLFEQQNTGNT